jgi:acyl-CoA thioesterase
MVASSGANAGGEAVRQDHALRQDRSTLDQAIRLPLRRGRSGFRAGKAMPASAYSRLWIGDRAPRKIDMLSLVSMSDAFFARIFHARRELVPFGTVTLTTYFHTSVEDLASEDITHVLACADAKVFNRSYQDQSGELWSPSGRLVATTSQMGYFKA